MSGGEDDEKIALSRLAVGWQKLPVAMAIFNFVPSTIARANFQRFFGNF